MRLPEEPENQGEINIVPMIDIIFSILAFFIISTLYLTRSESMPVNLPSASTTESQANDQIYVSINADGDIFLNRQGIALDQLKEKITPLILSNSNKVVVIDADEKVDHGQVVKVMDNLRQVKGARIAIAAKKIPDEQN